MFGSKFVLKSKTILAIIVAGATAALDLANAIPESDTSNWIVIAAAIAAAVSRFTATEQLTAAPTTRG
jgi:hypothetical protein